MAINANNMMLNMNISVKELNDKHQLNSNNTGLNAIDRCMCFMNDTLGISDILSIRIFEEADLFKVDFDSFSILIPASCGILKTNGDFGCIVEGSLNKADQVILIAADGSKRMEAINDIHVNAGRSLIYKIKTRRGNYILNNGIVVQSD